MEVEGTYLLCCSVLQCLLQCVAKEPYMLLDKNAKKSESLFSPWKLRGPIFRLNTPRMYLLRRGNMYCNVHADTATDPATDTATYTHTLEHTLQQTLLQILQNTPRLCNRLCNRHCNRHCSRHCKRHCNRHAHTSTLNLFLHQT